MANRKVVFSRRANAQVDGLFDYIAAEVSPDAALQFTESIFQSLANLAMFPHLGVAHDDVFAGLRLLTLRKRVVVAFVTDPSTVRIVGIFYGGQDFQTILRQDDED